MKQQKQDRVYAVKLTRQLASFGLAKSDLFLGLLTTNLVYLDCLDLQISVL